MGMFDWVDFECDCPKCGALVKDFQSKSGRCYLECLKPWEVDRFYTSCDKCDHWIEYVRKDPNTVTRRVPPPEPTGWRETFDVTCRPAAEVFGKRKA